MWSELTHQGLSSFMDGQSSCIQAPSGEREIRIDGKNTTTIDRPEIALNGDIVKKKDTVHEMV